MQLHLNSLAEQVREGEKRRGEEAAALRLENEHIIAGFREVEAEGASQQVMVMITMMMVVIMIMMMMVTMMIMFTQLYF
jgi:hypothetical protein